MLGHLSSELNMRRKMSLKPFLKDDYKSLCKEPSDKASDCLFGDDLAKTLKEVKEKSAVTGALKTPHFYPNEANKPQPQSFLYQRGRNTYHNYRYQHHPQRNNGGRFRRRPNRR